MRQQKYRQLLFLLRIKETTMKHSFDKKKYRQQVETNNLIGILLSLSAIAMAVILYILFTALQSRT